MRILLLTLLLSQIAFAESLITDQEAEQFMQKYDSFYDKKEVDKVDEVFAPDYFGDKKAKEEFISNVKKDKSPPSKSKWKIEKSNGNFKRVKVDGDRIFLLEKTSKGVRLKTSFEAE